MRFTLTYMRDDGERTDIAVSADVTVTVGQLAARLRRDGIRARDITLCAWYPGASDAVALDPLAALPESGLRPGSVVQAVPVAQIRPSTRRAYAIVAECVDESGTRWPLVDGVNLIGRHPAARVWLPSRTVSRRHAEIRIAAGVASISDLGAPNGTEVDGTLISHHTLADAETITIGTHSLTFRWVRPPADSPTPSDAFVDHIRPPRIASYAPPGERTLPAPPEPPAPPHLPLIAAISPIIMGAASYAVTLSPYALVLLALSPLMMLGGWLDNRLGATREHRRRLTEYHAGLVRLEAEIADDERREIEARASGHPGQADVANAILNHTELLWSRRPEYQGFLELRLGTGRDLGRTHLTLPERGAINDGEWRLLTQIRDRHRDVAPVPLVASLPESGAIGIVGSRSERDDASRAAIIHLAATHAPSDVGLVALADRETARAWQWLKWLPHVDAPGSPLAGAHLADGARDTARLLARLEQLIARRTHSAAQRRSHLPPTHRVGDAHGTPVTVESQLPALVVVVIGRPEADLGRIIHLAEQGPQVGIYTVWVRDSHAELPAACRTFLDIGPGNGGHISYVREGVRIALGASELCTAPTAERLARELASINDVGAPRRDDSDLPARVTLRELASYDAVGSAQGVIAAWSATQSITRHWSPATHRPPATLPAIVGMSVDGPLTLDLRDQGPHALVGGTTGSGKSEFLQAWIMSLAATYSPDRLTFLLVDYKGGAAFAECTRLPHTVGLVTDLTPRLVTRALTSLRAELTHRERILNSHGAKDLIAMECRSDPSAPPNLVIVIDEFAALAGDVPEFVDGVIDIAARGRSLGVHLILATQRPGGVITDNLRANTNLRIALRMADPSDSVDVIETDMAAFFDPATPGRAGVRVGPGRITGFQAAYLGAPVASTLPPPDLTIAELPFGPGAGWPEPPAGASPPCGPREIEAMRAHICEASDALRLIPPRRPWLDELPLVLDLAALGRVVPDRVVPAQQAGGDLGPGAAGPDPSAPPQNPPTTRPPESLPVEATGFSDSASPRSGPALVLGLRDEPQRQRQDPWVYFPERHGHLAVVGMAGSGKSSTLRTVAAAASAQATPDSPVWLYGLSSGSGLAALDHLPSYGGTIASDDAERVPRMLRWLTDLAAQRTARYAALHVANLSEYLRVAAQNDGVDAHHGEPRRCDPVADRARVFLLIDGWGALRDRWEYDRQFDLEKTLDDVLASGPQSGIHVVIAADRARALPSRYTGYFGLTVTLAVPDDEASLLGIPAGYVDGAPPGRAYCDGTEVQVAVPSAAITTRGVVEAFRALAAECASPPAPAIRILPERIPLGARGAVDQSGHPVVAVAADDLSDLGVPITGLLLVQGRRASGATTTLCTLVAALRRAGAASPDQAPTRSAVVWLRPAAAPTSPPPDCQIITGDSAVAAYLAERLDQPTKAEAAAGAAPSVRDPDWGIPHLDDGAVLPSVSTDALGHAVFAGSSPTAPSAATVRESADANDGVDAAPGFLPHDVVIVERLAEFCGTPAEQLIEALIRLAHRRKVTVVVESDPGLAEHSWGIATALRGTRTAILLRPEDGDGYALLRADLPPEDAGRFPPGRGYILHDGVLRKVQVALPS